MQSIFICSYNIQCSRFSLSQDVKIRLFCSCGRVINFRCTYALNRVIPGQIRGSNFWNGCNWSLAHIMFLKYKLDIFLRKWCLWLWRCFLYNIQEIRKRSLIVAKVSYFALMVYSLEKMWSTHCVPSIDLHAESIVPSKRYSL